MEFRQLFLFVLLLMIPWNSFCQADNLSVFYSNRGGDKPWLAYSENHRALYGIILEEAYELLEKRKEKVSRIDGEQGWKNYNDSLKNRLFSSIENFSKSPLYPKITGVIKKESYKIEKVLFESHPEFYVTGCLFIPDERQDPAPAVIYCSGHTELGFRSDTYQRVILNLVKKGFIVFAFDPIGQGERLQYLNEETGKSRIGGSTKEHTYAGVQTLISGTSLTDYFIWDGVRAVDYLMTRKEVDGKRIGITGRSGGGTQSAMIAAYDERIYASAPECYITSFKRLLQSIGPQDAEQNPLNAIKKGFDHPDFLHLRAPRPSLIVTTTHDYFSQQGARETYEEAKKSYTAFNARENIGMVTDMGVHESTKNNREAVYGFFQKHLENPGDNNDTDVGLFKPEELWVTPTGQLLSSIKGKTVYDLNREYYRKEEAGIQKPEEKIRELAGLRFDRKMTGAVFTGRIESNDCNVEKYFLESDKEDYALPVYVIAKKEGKAKKTLVWLTPEGKSKIYGDTLKMNFLDAGYRIISADLPGTGELFDPAFSGDGFIKGVPFNYTFGAHLVGKSIPGIHAEAIDLLMQFVKQQYPEDQKTDALIEEELNSAFLHYTAFNNPFSMIMFVNPVESASHLIGEEYYEPETAFHIVPGSLPWYDIKDLLAFIPFYRYKIIKWDKTSGTSKTSIFPEMIQWLKK